MQISDLIARLATDADYLDRFSGERTAIAKDIRDAIAALSLPVQPVADAAPWGWANENGAVTRFYPDKWISLGQKLTPLYTTPPVPPTKGPEDEKPDRFAYWNSLPESEKAKIRQSFHDDMFGGSDD